MAETPRSVRVFCDADVLIAGSASTTGASHVLLKLSELTLLDILATRYAVDEAARNLREKLPEALPAFRLILDASVDIIPAPPPSLLRTIVGQAHPKDIPILGAAIRGKADFLATFNLRHFRPRKSPPLILRPRDILFSIRSSLARLLQEAGEE